MMAINKGKLHINVHEVNGTELVNTLWPMKFCLKAGANLFSLTCELSEGNKISSDHCNNIMVKSSDGNIVLDCQMKTHDSWVTQVEFLQGTSQERAQSATALYKKNINDLHAELGHTSKTITHATAKAMDIQLTSTFKSCEDCTLGKAKKIRESKKTVGCSKILGEMLFFDVSSPSTPTFVGKKH